MKLHMERIRLNLPRELAIVLLCVIGLAKADQPRGEAVLQFLKTGNAHFASGQLTHTNTSLDRIYLAAHTNQGDYAIATIVACSDSRVPVEDVFDRGVMDLFVIRVAGNVCNTDEIGSVEYGVCHVNTPVLLVLGHSQCGAVTAVANQILGHGHALEKNIQPLVAPIIPVVEMVHAALPEATIEAIINRSIEENVWHGIEQIFLKSPIIREKVKSNKLIVVGAIYELESGTVRWLPKEKVASLLAGAESTTERNR